MKIEIKIPSMGESISTVVIGEIISPSGSIVKADTELLELETDKVNQVLFAPQGGKVTLSVKTGDKADVGQVIGFIEASEQKEAPKVPPAPPKEEKQPAIKLAKVEEGISLRKTKEVFLEELKSEKGVAVSKEVREIIQEQKPARVVVAGERKETRRPMSKVRKIIAGRMVEAQRTTAMLTTFNEADMELVMSLREKYKEAFQKKHGVKLGFMSFFVKAVVAALQDYPIFNSYLDGDDIVHREYYDLGIAVGTEKGVIVPVVRDCDQLTFAGIEQAIEGFAKKARDGTLKPDDLRGGGFTITNGGVYGSLLSTPILNPPQCGILGMHKIEKRPVVVDDQIVIRPMMYLALSYDHRLADGKEAVSFLVCVKNMLENPSRLLLEI